MYEYAKEKPTLLTDEGQICFIHNRDIVLNWLRQTGAVRMGTMSIHLKGSSSWFYLATFDRMVELGDIREITGKDEAGQNRVFVSAKP